MSILVPMLSCTLTFRHTPPPFPVGDDRRAKYRNAAIARGKSAAAAAAVEALSGKTQTDASAAVSDLVAVENAQKSTATIVEGESSSSTPDSTKKSQ